MKKNISEYFKEGYSFYLKNASYEYLSNLGEDGSYNLNCTDEVHTSKDEMNLNLYFKRRVYCDPEALFNISVEFGAILTFRNKDDAGEEIDWTKEFIKNSSFVLNGLISRTTLLIANISSSYGQPPIVTPPNPINTEE